MTVREALNAAMEEEMKLDSSVFLLGEEVGQYNGAYKVNHFLIGRYPRACWISLVQSESSTRLSRRWDLLE